MVRIGVFSPFTNEKTPSFSVNNEKKTYCDFSSGNRGGVIDFVCRYYRCNGYDAVSKIMEYIGMTSGDAAILERRHLPATKIARRFSQKQNRQKQFSGEILSPDFMERFEWDTDKFQPWLEEEITEEALRKFQVRYDPFGDRIVYPIRDIDGNIINVGGRSVDPEWKQKGLKKYVYYRKFGALNSIYGLFENMEDIKKEKEIILFEGCKSVMKSWGFGFKNAGAILTSHLNKQQFTILIKLGVSVVFALDKEVDIRQDKNIVKLMSYVPVYFIHDYNDLLDEKMSPVDHGAEIFEELLSDKRRLL